MLGRTSFFDALPELWYTVDYEMRRKNFAVSYKYTAKSEFVKS